MRRDWHGNCGGWTKRLPVGHEFPGWRLHPLRGALAGHYAVWVSGNWRLTFAFEGVHAVLVDYQDYR